MMNHHKPQIIDVRRILNHFKHISMDAFFDDMCVGFFLHTPLFFFVLFLFTIWSEMLNMLHYLLSPIQDLRLSKNGWYRIMLSDHMNELYVNCPASNSLSFCNWILPQNHFMTIASGSGTCAQELKVKIKGLFIYQIK